jgi:hypothetical protein
MRNEACQIISLNGKKGQPFSNSVVDEKKAIAWRNEKKVENSIITDRLFKEQEGEEKLFGMIIW